MRRLAREPGLWMALVVLAAIPALWSLAEADAAVRARACAEARGTLCGWGLDLRGPVAVVMGVVAVLVGATAFLPRGTLDGRRSRRMAAALVAVVGAVGAVSMSRPSLSCSYDDCVSWYEPSSLLLAALGLGLVVTAGLLWRTARA